MARAGAGCAGHNWAERELPTQLVGLLIEHLRVSPTAHTSIMPLDPDIAAELKSLGADADALVNTARTSRSSLTDTLKALGYNKMGARKKVEQALVAAAAAKPEAAVAPAEDAATGSQPPPAEEKAAAAPPPPPQPTPAPAPAAPAPAPPPPPVVRDADTAQAEGTAAFQLGRYAEAIEKYTEALGLRSDDATLLSDRSAAFLCIGHSENALDDATRCVKLRPNWGKAHGRHGAALAALGCTHDAVLAYERGQVNTGLGTDADRAVTVAYAFGK